MAGMTLCLFLTVCVLAVSALPVDEQQGRINGKNGWFVPQADGDLKWLSTQEAEGQLAAYETLNDLEIIERMSLNAVTFYLYTQRNPTEGQIIESTKTSIDASYFNPANPTRITIHGWNSNYKDGVNTGVRDAWFLAGDYNMIAVDWSRGRSLEYASSVAAVSATGKKIASQVDFLVTEYGMSLDTLEVVGFSVGAHVAGFAAKQVTTGQVQKVVGLDPASPLFSYNLPSKRLSSNDAFYVETIQTNGGNLGFTKPIGRAAFYPNGGKSQPGCGLDLTGGCSHTRAVYYYVESLRLDNFPTVKCSSYKHANKKDCGSTYSSVRMGSTENVFVAVGEFYVPLNKESPYGLGEAIEASSPTPLPTTVVGGSDDSTTPADDENSSTGEEDNTTVTEENDDTTTPADDVDNSSSASTPGGEDITTTPEEEVIITTSLPTTVTEENDDTTPAGEVTTTVTEENDDTTTPADDVDNSSSASNPGGEDITTTPEEEVIITTSLPTTVTEENDDTTTAGEVTTTVVEGNDDTTTLADDETSTPAAEDITSTPLPTTVSEENGDTTTPAEDGSNSSSASTPGGEVITTPAPEEGKDNGRKANIYILNLIFVNAQINKKGH